MIGNFIIDNYSYYGTDTTNVYWFHNSVPANGTIYLTLQRDGYDFNILKSGLFPERLDISKYNPLVSFQRTPETVTVYTITPSGITITGDLGLSGSDLVSVSGLLFGSGILVQDFRYAELLFGEYGFLPRLDGMDTDGKRNEILVAYSGGIGMIDVELLGTMSGVAQMDSGIAARIETTNSTIPDQYVFVAKSGVANLSSQTFGSLVSGEWGFSQKDPGGTFIDYSSGYPYSRTTMVRVDDSL